MTISSPNQERAVRPPLRSVLIVGVIFIILGALDVWRGIAPSLTVASRGHLATDDLEVLAIGIAALLGGIYLIRGANWARWLLAVWMAFHVAISIGQPFALIAHLVIFGCIAFVIFRPDASAYFTRPERG